MAHGNPDLQRRAGRNYPAFLGILQAQSFDAFNLKSNTTVVLEGSNDLNDTILPASIVAAFTGFLSPDFISIVNKSGGSIDAGLYFVDKYGSEVEIATTSIPDNGDGGLSPDLFFLSAGDRYELRTTASAGVSVFRGTVLATPQLFLRLASNERVTKTSFDFPYRAGVSPIANLYNLINTSPTTSVDYEVDYTFENGDVVTNASNGTISSGDVEAITIATLGSKGKATIRFTTPLPTDGYLYGAPIEIVPVNEYEPHPAYVG